jgi:predicted nucleotidyltransferase
LRPDEKIAGRPARYVRALLRRLRLDSWTIKEVARLLKVSEGQARRLVYTLRVLGYVEVVPQQRPGTWRNTMAGNALANASAAPPMSRAEASRQLEEFLERVELVNADESLPHRVGKVVIFGSYLSDRERIGDIDLAIRLDRRPQFADRWAEAVLARAEAAERRGRRFRGFIDRLAWAENEVKRVLRGGARLLSLHDWSTEEPWLQHAPHQVLLDEGPPAPAKDSNSRPLDSPIELAEPGIRARRPSRRSRDCFF